jgi:hypothetical protein
MAAGAPDRPSPGRNPDAANEAGTGDRTDCADKRFHVGGRSRVIHAFLVGFWCFCGEPDENPWATWLMGRDCASMCTSPGFAPTCRATWDKAAGCGSTVPATEDAREAQPVVTAARMPSAATTAMADRHRRALPAPRNVTVARMYNTEPGEQSKRAVKTIGVRCVLRRVASRPASHPARRLTGHRGGM